MSERSLNPAATAPPRTIRLIRQEQMPRRGTQPLAVRKDHADAETDRAFWIYVSTLPVGSCSLR